MPPRDKPYGDDTLSIPCYLAKGLDDPGFREWAKDHPDWFVAGTWTAAARPGARGARPGHDAEGSTAQDQSRASTPRERARAAVRITVGMGKLPPPPLDPSTISLADFLDVAANAKRRRSAQPLPPLETTPFGAPIDPRTPEPYANVETPHQRAAFLAQVAGETDDLRALVERTDYFSSRRITQLFPREFPNEAVAQPFVHNPVGLANRAYANKNGNRDEGSGDGYRFRGRGLIQITGRDPYTEVGFGNNPEGLETPRGASYASAEYWKNRGLNERTIGTLNHAQFDAITRTVNSGDPNAQRKWESYLRAVRTLENSQ